MELCDYPEVSSVLAPLSLVLLVVVAKGIPEVSVQGTWLDEEAPKLMELT